MECREPLGHGLIQRGRRDFDGVRDAVYVLDSDTARSDRPGGKILYSLSSSVVQLAREPQSENDRTRIPHSAIDART